MADACEALRRAAGDGDSRTRYGPFRYNAHRTVQVICKHGILVAHENFIQLLPHCAMVSKLCQPLLVVVQGVHFGSELGAIFEQAQRVLLGGKARQWGKLGVVGCPASRSYQSTCMSESSR